MKVVSSKQMAFIESQAYRDGASESEFMEEAGSGVSLIVHEYVERHDLNKHVVLLCGKGNNAGDAYVAGTHLLNLGYEVTALQVVPLHSCTPLCRANHSRFAAAGGYWREISNSDDMAFPLRGVILDGIFGTGFKGKVDEPFSTIIHQANNSGLPIIAIDIPSGLNGETGEVEGECIRATQTAFLGLPKTGFFLRDGWNYVGKLRYVDFGLPEQYIDQSEADFIMLTPELMKPLLPEIKHNRNKYERGYVAGLAGSPGMAGAAILSSWAAFAGGAGIVKLFHPQGMQEELTNSPYELIKVPYTYESLSTVIETLNKAAATFIGPGLGRSPQTKQLLQTILPKLEKPAVIDADALNILSETEIKLPQQVIFTPHKGEMERLLKLDAPQVVDKEFLKICQEYADKYQITLILKGGPTFIFHPDEIVHVNPYGDPGMATAGSGDVLTGILAALLAQGLVPMKAALLGVFLHAISGENAAAEKTSYCMMASDIIKHLPDAFRFRS